jgi:hypothetical protein
VDADDELLPGPGVRIAPWESMTSSFSSIGWDWSEEAVDPVEQEDAADDESFRWSVA